MALLNFLKSIYIPENSLQGDSFPGYVTWDETIDVTVTIHIPPGVVLTELNNVPDDGFSLQNNILEIKKFDTNGYIGFVFKTEILTEVSIIKEIKFSIKGNGSDIVEERNILLFRPNFLIKAVPHKIVINEISDGHYEITDCINLANEGLGTAIISTIFNKDNMDIQQLPSEIDEFKINFLQDFNHGLVELKTSYSIYSEILDELIAMNSDYSVVIINKEIMEKIERVSGELLKILTEDNNFKDEFFERLHYAYTKNSNFFSALGSFINYMQTSTSQKIFFPAATSKLKIKKSADRLQFQLIVLDLAKNKYSPLDVDIPLKITSKKDEILIPLHKLFNFESEPLLIGGT
jgi:hypothetical protein